MSGPNAATTGASSEIFVRGVTAGDGEITNEIWLSQNLSQNSYWVEGGYWANVGWNNGAQTWFWADSRPEDSNNVNVHPSSPMPGSGDGGQYAFVDIEQINSCTFDVFIDGFSTDLSGVSTNNCISPNDIQLGQELAGSSGANAPTADFTDNEFRGHLTSDPWAFITSKPSFSESDNPPSVHWIENPNHTDGGTFATCTGC